MMESKLVPGGGFGRGRECGCSFRTKPTRPSLLEQRCGKAKGGLGVGGGWMEAKRDGQGKQRWRLLQKNQATSLSLSRTRKLTHTSSFPAGATAHRALVDEEEELELGSSGWGARRWDGRNV